MYYVNITLFGSDGVLNRGPEAAMNLVESKFMNASGKLAKLLATDFYLDGQGTNSDTHQIDGMLAAFDNGNTYGSYAGIDRSDIVADGTNSQGINGYAAAMATFNFTTLQTAFGSCWIGAEKPDLIVTTQAVWNIFFNRLLPMQRFIDKESDVASTGFQALQWNGSTVVVGGYCPTGYMFGINTKNILLFISTLPLFQFGFTGFKESQQTIDVAGQYLFAGNLLFPAPRLNFVLSGITS